jgi:hypothetical protein
MFFCGHKPFCTIINDERAFRRVVRRSNDKLGVSSSNPALLIAKEWL